MEEHILFWSGAGFISSYYISSILIYKCDCNEALLLSHFTVIGLICGFIRGYTDKSIYELFFS